MAIPFLDLRAQNGAIRDELLAAMVKVMDSQQFILGDEVKQLEREIAAYCRTSFAVGCASGSDALYLALLALGIQPGDRVLTTPFTFFATAGAISLSGAVPVFADIDPATFNLDPVCAARALAADSRIRALIPVHLFGGCADMDPLCALAQERGVAVIEDAAQAIGADYQGRRAGSLGKIAAFSFYPSKNLGGCGDGGMLTTNDSALAERLSSLRVHGRTGTYIHQWIGINSRLDTLQAALLRVKLPHLDEWTRRRQANAARYQALLADAPVGLPQPAPYQTRHVYNQFVIRSAQRDQLQAHLTAQGIGTQIYYPLPLHLQACFRDLGYREGDFPESEKAAREVLALPIHEHLSARDIEMICGYIHAQVPVGRFSPLSP
jgi:dTDP-4-amino-4,6-dideoxygalactose transaminase